MTDEFGNGRTVRFDNEIEVRDSGVAKLTVGGVVFTFDKYHPHPGMYEFVYENTVIAKARADALSDEQQRFLHEAFGHHGHPRDDWGGWEEEGQ